MSRKAHRWRRWIAWHRGYSSELDETAQREIDPTTTLFEGDESADTFLVHNNYVFAYIDTMTANVCPTNPQVTFNAPRDREAVAKARETVANHLLRKTGTAAELTKANMWASIAGIGILKDFWDEEDNLPRSRCVPTSNLLWDDTVDFEKSAYYIEVLQVPEWYLEEMVEAGVYDSDVVAKMKPHNYQPDIVGEDPAEMRQNTDEDYYTIYEVHDRRSQRVVIVTLDDKETPLAEGPAPFVDVKRHYHAVVHTQDLQHFAGVSDIQLIDRILMRINEIDSLELEHAHFQIPSILMNDAAFQDPEAAVEALRGSSTPGGIIRMLLTSGRRFDEVIGTTPTSGPTVAFAVMRERLVSLLEMVLGLPQYMRGGTGSSEVATELALVDVGVRTRNGRRIVKNNNIVVNIARNLTNMAMAKMQSDAVFYAQVAANGAIQEIQQNELAPTVAEDMFVVDIAASSPTESHRMVQLQKLQQYLPFFTNHGNVDQGQLIKKVLELLDMGQLYVDAPPQPAAMPGEAQGAPAAGASAETFRSGGVPGGLDDAVMPDNLNTNTGVNEPVLPEAL